MQLAIELAQKGNGPVSPNPPVGAVLSRNGEIVGAGYHQKFGEAHAEVNALQNCDGEGGTLYITLEPCNHRGKTPPCVDTITDRKIDRVVVGSLDPNPQMQGHSIEILRTQGIEVEMGFLEDQTDELIRFYTHWMKTGRPYVTVKLALSADGFIAKPDGTSKWISSEESRMEVHRMRAEYDAVMVGTNTVLTDNPALTVRDAEGRNPSRVVIDRHRHVPQTAKVFSLNGTDIFYFSRAKRDDLPNHIQQLTFEDDESTLPTILEELGRNDQTSLLVEGGAAIAHSFVQDGLCEEVIIYRSPKKLKNGIPFDESKLSDLGFSLFEEAEAGVDRKIIYRRSYV